MTQTSHVALNLLVLIAAPPVYGAEGSPPSTIVTFDDAEIGHPPKGFTTALTGGGGPVAWLVQEDATARRGSKTLVQASADTTSARFPLCIYDAVVATDITLSVRFKAISGAVDQAAGLVWRYQNAANYYVVRANALESNVVLYKVEDGKRSDLKPVDGGFFSYGKKATVTQGRWQELKIDVRGPRFQVFLDGKHLFDVEDPTFTGPGKVGLWTKADSVTAFDDLRSEDVR